MSKTRLSLIAGSLAVMALASCSAPAVQNAQDTSQPVTEQPPLPVAMLTPPESFGEALTITSFTCGDETLATVFHEKGLLITSDTLGHLALPQVMSASGVKYEGDGDVGHVIFWNKGSEATVWIDEADWPTCFEAEDGMESPNLMTELTSHEWVVTSLKGAALPDGTQATLNFSEDGFISGSTGCNSYRGNYKVSSASITLGGLASTKKACFGGAMDVERDFLAVMSGTLDTTLGEDGTLVLSSESGTLSAR